MSFNKHHPNYNPMFYTGRQPAQRPLPPQDVIRDGIAWCLRNLGHCSVSKLRFQGLPPQHRQVLWRTISDRYESEYGRPFREVVQEVKAGLAAEVTNGAENGAAAPERPDPSP